MTQGCASNLPPINILGKRDRCNWIRKYKIGKTHVRKWNGSEHIVCLSSLVKERKPWRKNRTFFCRWHAVEQSSCSQNHVL